MNTEKNKNIYIMIVSALCFIVLLFNKQFIGETIVLLALLIKPLLDRRNVYDFKLNKTQKIQLIVFNLFIYLKSLYQNGSPIRYFNKLFRYPLGLLLIILSLPCTIKIIKYLYDEIEKIKDKSKSYFKSVFAIILFVEIIYLIVNLFFIDTTFIDRFMSIIRFPFSIFIIDYLLYRVTNNKKMIDYLSLIIIALLLVTTFINIQIYGSYVFYYTYAWFYNATFNVAFLPYAFVYIKNNYKKQLILALKIFIIVWTVYMIMVLLRIYTTFGETWLHGIGFNSNGYLYVRTTAPILSFRQFTFVIVTSLIVYYQNDKKSKILWHIPLLINLTVMYLSNERTPYYALLILICLASVLFYYNKRKLKYLFLVVLMLFIVVGLRKITFNTLKYAKSDIYLNLVAGKYSSVDENYNPVYEINTQQDNGNEVNVNGRNGFGGGFTIRLQYWKLAAENITKEPLILLFGCSETELTDTLGLFGINDKHMHNEFINMLVARGIFVTLSFIAYCGYILIIGFKKVLKYKDLNVGIFTIVIFGIILLYMMDSGLLTSMDIYQMLFYSLVGLILENEITNKGI